MHQFGDHVHRVAGFLSVQSIDKHDAAQPRSETERPEEEKLSLGEDGTSVWQHLGHTCKERSDLVHQSFGVVKCRFGLVKYECILALCPEIIFKY